MLLPPYVTLFVLCTFFAPSSLTPPDSSKRYFKLVAEPTATSEKPLASAVGVALLSSKAKKGAALGASSHGAHLLCSTKEGTKHKKMDSPLRSFKPEEQLHYGGTSYEENTDYLSTNDYFLLPDPQQYVMSMETVTGDRLHGDRGSTNYAHLQEPNLYNLPEASELWTFEPFLADGKIVYQIKNVDLALYLKASSEIKELYYHLCKLVPQNDNDMTMYWEIGPGPERKIKNVYYDEFLVAASGNDTNFAMTHPRPGRWDGVNWILTKKADLFKVKSPRPMHHG